MKVKITQSERRRVEGQFVGHMETLDEHIERISTENPTWKFIQVLVLYNQVTVGFGESFFKVLWKI